MPLIQLQHIVSRSSPCEWPKRTYEEGWTYVERRPGGLTQLRRTFRSRAPSPELSSALLQCTPVQDHCRCHAYDNHHYRDCGPDPIIIQRSPRTCSPPPKSPVPSPKSKEPPERTAPASSDAATARAAAEIAHLRAQVLAAEEAKLEALRESQGRKSHEDSDLLERLLERFSEGSPRHSSPCAPRPSSWERDREAARWKEWHRLRELDRQRAACRREGGDRETGREMASEVREERWRRDPESQRKEDRARKWEAECELRCQRERERERAQDRRRDEERERERDREREKGRRLYSLVRDICPNQCHGRCSAASSSSISICPSTWQRPDGPALCSCTKNESDWASPRADCGGSDRPFDSNGGVAERKKGRWDCCKNERRCAEAQAVESIPRRYGGRGRSDPYVL